MGKSGIIRMPFAKITGNKAIYTCDLCDTSMQMGQGLYEGTYLNEIDGTFCRSCFAEHPMNPVERAKGVTRLRIQIAAKNANKRAVEQPN